MVQVFLEWSQILTLILTWIIQIPLKWLSHEVSCPSDLITVCKRGFLELNLILFPDLQQLETILPTQQLPL